MDSLRKVGALQAVDCAFARTLARRAATECAREALVCAALAFRVVREGHVCLRLDRVQEIVETLAEAPVSLPDREILRESLRKAPFVREVAADGKDPGGDTPLVLDHDRLYLDRYHREEGVVVARCLERLAVRREVPGLDAVQGLGEPEHRGLSKAIRLAATRGLVIITGGPGTGKTTAATHILAALARLGWEPERFSLLAPTGRAAARLAEVVREGLKSVPLPEDLCARFPGDGQTIHRALGVDPRDPFHARRVLPRSAVVVDEASMVDLVLMARVFEAVEADAPLILLGDPHQLASVEAGAVLADLCDSIAVAPVLVRLRRRYRFDEPIAAVADAILDGKVPARRETEQFRWSDLDSEGRWWRELERTAREHFAPVIQAGEQGRVEEAIEALPAFRILCAVRRGPAGCETLNRRLLDQWFPRVSDRGMAPGRIVLVTENDYNEGLYNGDIGVVVRTPNGLRVCFGGLEPGAAPRVFEPGRLPAHEDAFAMTIHKAQGSQYARVAVVLPPYDSPVLSQELVYTGVTRAQEHLMLFARSEVLATAVRRPVNRASGLRIRLDREASETMPDARDTSRGF